MNKKLAIIGAGGHAKVVLETALLMQHWESIVFIDDNHKDKTEFMGFPLLGTSNLLGKTVTPQEYDIALGIGDNSARAQQFTEIEQLGFSFPVIVHPTAFVSRFASIGAGSVLFAQTAVNAGAVIGKAAIINTSASVDHDCILDDFVHISPGANLAAAMSLLTVLFHAVRSIAAVTQMRSLRRPMPSATGPDSRVNSAKNTTPMIIMTRKVSRW